MKGRRIIDWAYKLIRPLCYFLSFFFFFCISNFFRRTKNIIWSYKMQRKFYSCGNNFSLTVPFDIFGFENITLGENVSLPAHTRIHVFKWFHDQSFNPELIIGDNVIFNERIHIACINKISIGKNTLFGSGVLIMDNSHGTSTKDDINVSPKDRNLVSKGPIIIGDNCGIGDNCVILDGCKLGDNCVIGAGTVLNKEYPANSVIVGAPGRIIREV